MSMFGNIMAKIFHHGGAAAPTTPVAEPASAPASPQPSAGAASENAGRPSQPVSPAGTTAAAPAAAAPATHDDPTTMGTPAAATPPAAPVDVAAVLDGLAAKNSQKLDWKHSIVDMLKLLDLDSSLTARQELAKELSYTGNMQDSATMNLWLHKQVMQKLAQNGGKVPDDLKV